MIIGEEWFVLALVVSKYLYLNYMYICYCMGLQPQPKSQEHEKKEYPLGLSGCSFVGQLLDTFSGEIQSLHKVPCCLD